MIRRDSSEVLGNIGAGGDPDPGSPSLCAEDLVTRTEATRILRYASPGGVRKLVSRGLLTPHVVGGRHYYKRAAVERLRDSRRHAMDGPGRWPASDPAIEMNRDLDAFERELAAARRSAEVSASKRRRRSDQNTVRLREVRERVTRSMEALEREQMAAALGREQQTEREPVEDEETMEEEELDAAE